MKELFHKIKKSIDEKRFLKTIKKKLYPYIKGLLLLVSFNKNNIRIFIPKKKYYRHGRFKSC